MNRERHIHTRSEEKGKGWGVWRVCQERRTALFLLPTTARDLIQGRKGTLNGLAVLNYQDLHGNDDYLLMFNEKEGPKSSANQLPRYFNPATLKDLSFGEV